MDILPNGNIYYVRFRHERYNHNKSSTIHARYFHTVENPRGITQKKKKTFDCLHALVELRSCLNAIVVLKKKYFFIISEEKSNIYPMVK